MVLQSWKLMDARPDMVCKILGLLAASLLARGSGGRQTALASGANPSNRVGVQIAASANQHPQTHQAVASPATETRRSACWQARWQVLGWSVVRFLRSHADAQVRHNSAVTYTSGRALMPMFTWLRLSAPDFGVGVQRQRFTEAVRPHCYHEFLLKVNQRAFAVMVSES